jgi:hypothetical protein
VSSNGFETSRENSHHVCLHPDESGIPSLLLPGLQEESGDKLIFSELAWKFSYNLNTMNDPRSEWGKDCILREDIQYFIVPGE